MPPPPPTRERHPCQSPADTAGSNPRFKMHNCETEEAEVTICGLPATEVNRVDGFTSLCPVCWPLEPWDGDVPDEPPWTGKDPNPGREGDVISGRLVGG